MLRWSSVYFGSYQNLEWGSCSFPRCCKTATLNNINIAEFEWFAGQQSLKMQLVLSVWSEASPARTSWCSCLQSEELTEIIWPSNNPGTSRTWGMRHVGMGHRAMGHQWPEIPGHRKGFPQIPNHQPPTPTTNPHHQAPHHQPPTTKPPNTNHRPPSTNPQPIPHSQEARLHFQKRVLLKICTAEVLSGDTDRLEGHCCWQLKDEKSLIISLDAWTNGTLTSCRSPMHIRAWKCQFHECPESSREFRWRKKWIKALNHIKSTRYQQLPVTVEI